MWTQATEYTALKHHCAAKIRDVKSEMFGCIKSPGQDMVKHVLFGITDSESVV